MINFDDYTHESKSEYNSKWPYIPDIHTEYLLNEVLDQENKMHY